MPIEQFLTSSNILLPLLLLQLEPYFLMHYPILFSCNKNLIDIFNNLCRYSDCINHPTQHTITVTVLAFLKKKSRYIMYLVSCNETSESGMCGIRHAAFCTVFLPSPALRKFASSSAFREFKCEFSLGIIQEFQILRPSNAI